MAATNNQLTCVFISKEGKAECGLPAIGQCNMCKFHVIQTLMDEEKLQKKRTKASNKAQQEPEVTNEKPAKKAKKEKKVKGLNKPKRAMTAYMAFCAENRAQIIEDFEGIKQTEIIKKLGEMWAVIKENPEKIQPYLDLAAQDKERFNREMEAFSSDNETTTTTTENVVESE